MFDSSKLDEVCQEVRESIATLEAGNGTFEDVRNIVGICQFMHYGAQLAGDEEAQFCCNCALIEFAEMRAKEELTGQLIMTANHAKILRIIAALFAPFWRAQSVEMLARVWAEIERDMLGKRPA